MDCFTNISVHPFPMPPSLVGSRLRRSEQLGDVIREAQLVVDGRVIGCPNCIEDRTHGWWKGCDEVHRRGLLKVIILCLVDLWWKSWYLQKLHFLDSRRIGLVPCGSWTEKRLSTSKQVQKKSTLLWLAWVPDAVSQSIQSVAETSQQWPILSTFYD